MYDDMPANPVLRDDQLIGPSELVGHAVSVGTRFTAEYNSMQGCWMVVVNRNGATSNLYVNRDLVEGCEDLTQLRHALVRLGNLSVLEAMDLATTIVGTPTGRTTRPARAEENVGPTPASAPIAETPRPFKIGDHVRQIAGEGMEQNQDCVVEKIKFVREGGFAGWAMRLRGRTKPYACNLFERITARGRNSPRSLSADDIARGVESIHQRQLTLSDLMRAGQVRTTSDGVSWGVAYTAGMSNEEQYRAAMQARGIQLDEGARATQPPTQPPAPTEPVPLEPRPRRRVIRKGQQP